MNPRARNLRLVLACALACAVVCAAAASAATRSSKRATTTRTKPVATAPTPAPAPVDSVRQEWNAAHALSDQGLYAQALESLAAALRAHPGNVDLTWLEAAVYGYAGNHHESVARYERLLAAHPELARDVRKDLATERFRAEDYAGAIRDFDLRIAEDPTDRESRVMRATALSYADRNREALAAYDELLREDPSDLDLALERARVLGWMGRHADAIAAYRGVLAQDSSRTLARLGIAQNQNWSGHPRDAAASYDSLRAAGSTDPAIDKGLAFALYWSGHPGRADTVLARYCAAHPEDAEARDLADRVARERSPGVGVGYGRSDDSDGQRIETRRIDLRFPLPQESAVLFGWRRNSVSDPGGTFDPVWWTATLERIWGDLVIGRGTLGYYQRDHETEGFGVGEASVTWKPRDPLRLDVGFSKDAIDTRRSTELNIVAETWVLGFDWTVNDRVMVHGDGRIRDYSDDNHATSLAAAVRGRIHAERRWRAFATARVEQLRTDQNLDHGYYDPERYIEGGPGLELEWEPERRWSVNVDARTGWQQEEGSDTQPFYNVSGNVDVLLNRLFVLHFEAGQSNSNLSSTSGFEMKRWAVSLSRSFFKL